MSPKAIPHKATVPDIPYVPSFGPTVDAEKLYIYRKSGGGINLPKYYIFSCDLSLIFVAEICKLSVS